MVDGADYFHSIVAQSLGCLLERLGICDLQRQVLHPGRSVWIERHRFSIGEIEEGDVTAVRHLKENMHVWALGAGGGHPLFGHRHGELQAQRLGVEISGPFRVFAAICNVMHAFHNHWTFSVRAAPDAVASNCGPALEVTELGSSRNARCSALKRSGASSWGMCEEFSKT